MAAAVRTPGGGRRRGGLNSHKRPELAFPGASLETVRLDPDIVLIVAAFGGQQPSHHGLRRAGQQRRPLGQ
jgi:hypothetical protein